jgi:DNA-directed RNA polymerase subunit H (RpoH/RPB5)
MASTISLSRQTRCAIASLATLVCYSTGLSAQVSSGEHIPELTTPLHVTHVLGFEGLSANASGDLSINGDILRFHKADGSSTQIMVSSIRDVVLGEQDKEVGGTPMALGRAATPYGGGRLIALFAHKKYDIVTIEYRDPDGGFHGALFQMNKGQGQVLRHALVPEDTLMNRSEHSAVPAALVASPNVLPAQASTGPSIVEIDQVNPGNVNIEPAFRTAIYENLVDALTKSKQFKEVLRSGDRKADSLPDLLILRTTVEAYTPGSERRRAVTTFSGATKLRVRSQLCTRAGNVVLETVVDGNVRFLGSNLRATHNLARNVADRIHHSLPTPGPSAGEQHASLSGQ